MRPAELEAAGRGAGVWPQGGRDSLTETLQLWTRQPGYPLVTVARQGDTLHFSQVGRLYILSPRHFSLTTG